MKKKLTSDDDIVEWVVEEAFVKDEYKHRPNCNDPRQLLIFKLPF